MNANVTIPDSHQVSGILKEHWDKFTEDDLQRIEKMRNEIVELMQQRYNYAKHKAEEELDRFLDSSNTRIKGVAHKLPGDVDQNLLRYPWVTIVTAVGVGFILGFLLKPGR